MTVDPKLKDYATSRQAQMIDALIETGSQSKAGEKLGVSKNAIWEAVQAVKKKAARAGYAPGHFEHGVAPGYAMQKVTVQRSAKGEVERTWERQSPDAAAHAEALQAAAAAMAEELPRLDPIEGPHTTLAHLCNLYTLTDTHIGMRAWAKEGGADWDLKIAERTLVGCFEQMVITSPRARVAVVNQLGDFLHYDGRAAVTPTHGHLLDADGSFSQMVAAAIRILRRVVDVALMRHDEVHLIIAEGNHDLAASVWLRQMFAALYENEPRLKVNDSELPFYVHQHGKTMLAFHHGHQVKNDALPGLFAAQFSRIWGDTDKRYCHVGHRHHVDEKEHAGMKVIQHSTLSARDAYAARGGWTSDREATAITYHDRFGQVGRSTVSPEMLDAA